MKTRKSKCIIVLLVLCFLNFGLLFSDEADIYSSASSESLEIYAGYYGYEPEHIYTYYNSDDLEALGAIYCVFSWLDGMPAPITHSVRAVYFKDVIEGAGIDINSVKSFDFYATDRPDTPWHPDSMHTPASMFNTTRYYYPHLSERWDMVMNKPMIGADEDKVPIMPMISIAEKWERYGIPDFSSLESYKGYRICYGMRDLSDSQGQQATRSLYKIVCILPGSPPEDPDKDSDKDPVEGENPGGGKQEEGLIGGNLPPAGDPNGDPNGKSNGSPNGDPNGSPNGNEIGAGNTESGNDISKKNSGEGEGTKDEEEDLTKAAAITEVTVAQIGEDGIVEGSGTRFYEVSPDAVALSLSPSDNTALPYVLGLLGFAFVGGGCFQFFVPIKGFWIK